MSTKLCRDCDHYCVYCQICHVDKDYHDFNDSCKEYEPEINDIEKESEVENQSESFEPMEPLHKHFEE